MLSIGLWRWYINMIILFKTQLNYIGLSVPHRKRITPALQAQQINAIYIGLWRWYINITIRIVDIFQLTVFYLKQRSGDWILSLSSAVICSVGTNRANLCLIN
jgi:hypothetical protein